MCISGIEYVRLSKKAINSNLSGNAKIFYIKLLLLSGSADFFVEDISVMLGCSHRTVTSVVRELVEAGYIEKERKFGSASHYEVVK